jgi:hypothetical protein
VGNASNSSSAIYRKELMQKVNHHIEFGWLDIREAISRNNLPKLLREHDYFVHAFQGSLDKSVVEATMCKLPVLSLNQAYVNEFGIWGSEEADLDSQFTFIRSQSSKTIFSEINRRYDLALSNHSLAHWIRKVGEILA